jgi:peptidoglycan-N-acetylglucosamine deacetylase
MYLIKTPSIIQTCFPGFLWRMSATEKTIYLTFDDGPIPEVTPWVLDQLDAHNAKATFFCVGENVAKHPAIYAELQGRGHRVGNHTYNHWSGWATGTSDYIANVASCAALVDSDLFRPPYGRLSPQQAKLLRSRYSIVMWDVLSGDFDNKLSGEQCWDNVRKHTQPGSIVVFHDSLKAKERLYEVLPKTLAYFSERGYGFRGIG